MWETVPKVATPVALAAFFLGIVLVIVRVYIRRQGELIKLAPPDQRPKLIDEVLSDYGIRAENLTRTQRYQLVSKALEQRAFRFKASAIVLVVFALVLAAVILAAIFVQARQASPTTASSSSAKSIVVPPIPASEVLKIAYEKDPPPAPADMPQPTLQFEVLGRRAEQNTFSPVRTGDLLASRVDEYILFAKPLTEGYLYIFQVDSSGRIEWFFPANGTSTLSSGENPVVAGHDILIPPRTAHQAIFLDNVTGAEQVYAVFSSSRWSELEDALIRAGAARPLASRASETVLRGGASSVQGALQEPLGLELRGPGGTREIYSRVELTAFSKLYSLTVKGKRLEGKDGVLVVERSFRHVSE